jgi:NAD(P)-dependent dehydrogenase (short-subunit alcohol dehydrogenase family)
MSSTRSAVVLGASGGLGTAVFEQLVADPAFDHVFGVSRAPADEAGSPSAHWLQADCTDPGQLADVVEEIDFHSGGVGLLINCTGMLHEQGGRPEKSLRELETRAFAEMMRVNALAPVQALATFMPLLRKVPDSKAVTLSAMVGSIGDNQLGGWYSYRMSKAALNMGLRSAAIEAARYQQGPVIVALHPGTTLTNLSKEYVRRRPNRSARCSAEHILNVVAGLGSEDSGKFFNWDGRELPW